MRILGCCIVFAVSVLATGCGGDDGGSYSASDIVAEIPSGEIDGAAWTMVKAVVSADDIADAPLSVTLLAEDVDDCSFSLGDGDIILFSIPPEVGEYPLSFDFSEDSQTVTFATADNNNIISSDGLLVVDQISATQVTIGLIAAAEGSSVNGRFTATICPSPF